MWKNVKKILFIALLLFLFLIPTIVYAGSSYYDTDYERRRQEAISIIKSINPPTDYTRLPETTNAPDNTYTEVQENSSGTIIFFLFIFAALLILAVCIIPVLSKRKNEIIQEEKKYDNKPNLNISSDKFPMNWYNFYYKFILPISIFVNTISLLNFIINEYLTASEVMLNLIINVGYIYFLWFVRKCMKERKKDTFNYLIINLLLTVFLNINYTDLISIISQAIILLLIYFLPQYIYFNKRKEMFIN